MFEGKSVLVTGAASGIGRAAAIRFAREGALVCVADRDEFDARSVATSIQDEGGTAVAVTADVTVPDQVEAMVDCAARPTNGLDIAFLNAGFLGTMAGFEGTDLASFDRAIDINLRGCFLGLKAVLPRIRDGGAVVVTASTAGVTGFAEAPGYAAAKHGVVGLVRSATAAFAARGARINVLCPGGVATPMIGSPNGEIVPPATLSTVAFRGMGSAQHVAELALWLASPAAGFVTGQVHICDAGVLSGFPESD